MAARPRVLLVTHIPFWGLGDGQRMRLLALAWILGRNTDLTLLYLGDLREADRLRFAQLRVAAQLQAVGTQGGVQAVAAAVSAFCASRRFDACILERIGLDFLRAALPPGVRTVLDTHDLVSARAAARRARGLPDAGVSFEQEVSILERYERVLMIQADEWAQVKPRLGDRALLVPHPVVFPQRPVRPGGRTLGFVGSSNDANRDALDWFTDRVWPGLRAGGAELHLYGSIGQVWRPGAHAEIVRHGFIGDFNRVWGTIDVAVNPILWGSGLKVKNVEALGNGVPLVTSDHGAAGMRAAAGEAFALARDEQEFAQACAALLGDPQRRQRMGAAAYAYARRYFSPEACFAELLGWLGTSGSPA